MAELNDLINLADLISKNKLKEVESHNDPSSLSFKFYDGLVQRKFDNDLGACKHIYGEDKISGKYQRLKSRVYDRLINSLFLIDVNSPKFSEIKKAYQTCQKNLAAVNILISNFNRHPAIVLAERTLKRSEYFEFTSISLQLVHVLWLHYGTIDLNKKKQKKYELLLEKYNRINQLEIKAQKYYQALLINHNISSHSSKQIIPISKKYAGELLEIILNNHSYQLMVYSSMVIINSHELDFDYLGVIDTVEKFNKYLEKKPHLISSSITFVFNVKLLIGHIALKNFKEAELAAKKGLEAVPYHSLNWFILQYYQLILLLHSNQYDKSYHVFSEVNDNPNFNYTLKFVRELLLINSAYIHYLIRIGRIIPDRPRKFRINKFLNEVPVYSRDKRGANISILVIQVLFLLEQKKFNALIDRLEALERYSYRYLRRDDTFRSNCFIKMLLLLPPADFHPERVAHRAQPLLEKLRAVPLEMAKQPTEIELIPYETLWEFVLESLRGRNDRQKRRE